MTAQARHLEIPGILPDIGVGKRTDLVRLLQVRPVMMLLKTIGMPSAPICTGSVVGVLEGKAQSQAATLQRPGPRDLERAVRRQRRRQVGGGQRLPRRRKRQDRLPRRRQCE